MARTKKHNGHTVLGAFSNSGKIIIMTEREREKKSGGDYAKEWKSTERTNGWSYGRERESLAIGRNATKVRQE